MDRSRKYKLTKRTVDGMAPQSVRYTVLDTEISGFRIRVSPTGKKSFYLRYRVGGGRDATIREPKIGDLGQVTPDQAGRLPTTGRQRFAREAIPAALVKAIEMHRA